MSGLPDEFFDEFWERIGPTEDDGISAVRLIGEMFATNLIYRDGDDLIAGNDGINRLTLTAEDQFLVRRIQDAAEGAQIAAEATS